MVKGNRKQSERVKGNFKPSSSSSAAELLSKDSPFSGAVPLGLTFNSFSTTRDFQNSSSLSDSSFSSQSYENLDNELVLNLKKLNKRNSITKVKALEEILVRLNSVTEDVYYTFLTAYVPYYQKLVYDLERRVRLLNNQVLQKIIKELGKNIKPQLKQLLPAWISCFYDNNRDISDLAYNNFKEIFSLEKHPSVLKFAHYEILDYLVNHLVYQTKETFSDSRFYTEEEAEQRYSLYITSCLGIFKYLLENLSYEKRESEIELYNKIIDDEKFFSFFSYQDIPIRRSAYQLFITFCLKDSESTKSRLERFAKTIFMKCFSESDTNTFKIIFEALIIATKTFPDFWVLSKRSNLGKLIRFIENGCESSLKFTLSNLPVLISHMSLPTLASNNGLQSLKTTILSSYTGKLINISKQEIQTLQYKVTLQIYLIILDRIIKANDHVSLELLNYICSSSYSLFSPNISQKETSIFEEVIEANLTLYARLLFNISRNYLNFGDEEGFDNHMMELEGRIFSIISSQLQDLGEETKEVAEFKLNARQVGNLLGFIINECSDEFLDVYERFKQMTESIIMESFDLLKNESEPLHYHAFILFCISYPNLINKLDINTSLNNNSESIDLILNKMVYYDIELGLNTILQDIESLESLSSLSLIEKLMDISNLPTSKIGYESKLALISNLIERMISGQFKVLKYNIIENWLISIFKNLLAAQELYYISSTNPIVNSSLPLLILLKNIFISPCEVFSNGFFSNLFELISNTLITVKYLLLREFNLDYEHDSLLLWKSISLLQFYFIGIKLSLESDEKSRALFLNRVIQYSPDLFPQYIYFRNFKLESKYLDDGYPHQICLKILIQNSKDLYKHFYDNLHIYEFNDCLDISKRYLIAVKNDLMNQTALIDPIEQAERGNEIIKHIYTHPEFESNEFKAFIRDVFPSNEEWDSCRRQCSIHPYICAEWFASAYYGFYSLAKSSKTLSFSENIFDLSKLNIILEFTTNLFLSIDVKILKEIEYFTDIISQLLVTSFIKPIIKSVDEQPQISLEKLHEAITVDQSLWKILEKWGLDLNFKIKSELLLVLFKSVLKLQVNNEILKYVSCAVIFEKAVPNLEDDWVDIVISEPFDFILNSILLQRSHLSYDLGSQTKFIDFKICILNSTINSNITSVDDLFTLEKMIVNILSLKQVRLPSEYYNQLGEWCFRSLELIYKLQNDGSIIGYTILALCQILYDIQFPLNNLEKQTYNTFINILTAILSSKEIKPFTWFIKEASIHLFYRISSLNEKDNNILFITYQNEKAKIDKVMFKLFLYEGESETSSASSNFMISKVNFINVLSHYISITLEDDYLFEERPINRLLGMMESQYFSIIKSSTIMLLKVFESDLKAAEKTIELNANNSDSETDEEVELPKLPVQLLIKLKNIEPGEDIVSIFKFLLTWYLVLDHLKTYSFELKSIYTDQIKELPSLNRLFDLLAELLYMTNEKPFDASKFSYDIDLTHIEPTETCLNITSSCLLFLILQNIPTTFRTWWHTIKNRKQIQDIENYVSKYYSKKLISSALERLGTQEAKNELCDDAFDYKVYKDEVDITYEIDETALKVSFKVPNNYPLKSVELNGIRHPSIPEKRWRAWILNSTGMFVAQNGTIYDAVNLFKKNITLHFSGVEDCAICYSIVGVLDNSLPNRACRTCKKKFHAACLYKWFRTSAQSTCPMCRNLF